MTQINICIFFEKVLPSLPTPHRFRDGHLSHRRRWGLGRAARPELKEKKRDLEFWRSEKWGFMWDLCGIFRGPFGFRWDV